MIDDDATTQDETLALIMECINAAWNFVKPNANFIEILEENMQNNNETIRNLSFEGLKLVYLNHKHLSELFVECCTGVLLHLLNLSRIEKRDVQDVDKGEIKKSTC